MKPIHNSANSCFLASAVVSHHKVNDLNETNSQLRLYGISDIKVVSHHKVNDLNETNSQLYRQDKA